MGTERSTGIPVSGYQFFDDLLREYGKNGRLKIGPLEGGNQLTLSRNQKTLHARFSNELLENSEYWVIGPKGPRRITSESPEKSVITGLRMMMKGTVRIGDLALDLREEVTERFEPLFVLRIRQMFKI